MSKTKLPFEIVMRDPALLIPYDLNAKLHNPTQVAKIVKAIQSSGWDVPIVVDKHGVIIKGHGRRLAALELDMKMVPVIVRSDLTPEQVKAARLADNRVAQGDVDADLLRASIRELDTELLAGIFDDKELNFIEADLGEMNDGVFVDDMAATLSEQSADIGQRAEKAGAARVPLAKAFGVKDVPGAAQILITRLMARAEATTGKAGADALVAWIEETVPA